MALSTAASEEDRLTRMARQMSKWVDQVVGPTYHKYCPAESWTPSLNVYEADDHYCVVVELSGMSPEKIDLKLDKGTLVLSGDRASPPLADNSRPGRVHLMEIDHGRFCRSVEVPGDVDGEAISATYRGGYLFIRLPKKM